jgi:hypothetical protein
VLLKSLAVFAVRVVSSFFGCWSTAFTFSHSKIVS